MYNTRRYQPPQLLPKRNFGQKQKQTFFSQLPHIPQTRQPTTLPQQQSLEFISELIKYISEHLLILDFLNYDLQI